MVGFQKGDRVGELRIGHGLPPPCTVLPVEVASHASVPSEPFAKAESAVEVRIGSGGRIVRRWSAAFPPRSEEHTSELQSLMRNSYAVFCLKKKKHTITPAQT